MAPNFERNLLQDATYWVQTGTDLYNKGVFSAPVVLKCRWEDMSELFIDKTGQEVTCKSRVYFAVDIALEGYLLLGTSVATDPTSVVGAFEVRQVKRTVDLRNVKTLYAVYL